MLSAGPSAAEVLARHAAVEFAEPDRTVRLAFEPDDEFYGEHPDLDEGQWGIAKAKVDDAWDTVRGAASVTVAILDTGADPTHPDLVGALVRGNTFVTDPDDECVPGTTRDDNSHGTHVAGVVGASGDNGIGIAGVAFGVKVMPVKVLDCTGQGNLSDVARGLVWAIDNGARIVNLSLGSTSDSPTLRTAIEYAADKNVIVVTASGNCGTTGDKCLSLNQTEYPAGYTEVLAVSATDTDDTVAFFSTRNETVDVAAPGRRILSTTPTYATFLSERETNPASLDYAVFSGTSQAAPFVAGVAALVWSAEPSLTAEAVMARIRTTADDLGTKGRDDSFGAGRVNALRAITTSEEDYGVQYDISALPTAATPARAFTATVVVTNKSSFDWRRANPSAVRLEWSWLDPAGVAVPGLASSISLPTDVKVGASATLIGPITTPAQAGPHTLRLDLVRDGVTAFSLRGAPAATLTVVIGSGIGATYEAAPADISLDAGSAGSIEVVVRNSGTVAWAAAGENPVRLASHWLEGTAVLTWEGLRASFAKDVAPGERVTVALPVMAPAKAGTYTLRVDLVQEGITWYADLGVKPLDIKASVRSGYVATYAVGTPPILLPGGRASIPVKVKNTGTATWAAAGSNPVRLAAHLVDRTGAVLVWDGERTLLAADVAPGATVDTAVVVDAPPAAGSYRVRVDAVREGVAWFSGLGVAPGEVDLLVSADYRAELPTGPLAVSAADPAVEVLVKNLGVATWTVAIASPIALSAHWHDAAGNVLVWDGPRTPLAAPVAPGGAITVKVALGPVPEGAASVTIDLVSEGLRWFGAGLPRPVTLGP